MDITPDLLLRAYTVGIFPMAEDAEDTDIFWVDPDMRGIIPLDGFHLPKSLQKTLRRGHSRGRPFYVRYNQNFLKTLEGCSQATEKRPNTWINQQIKDLYLSLHQSGYAHSVECYAVDDHSLIGGLYGVQIGSAFFGESMFSIWPDASKISLAYLLVSLVKNHFQLLDTQFITDHLQKFGAIEIPRQDYKARLTQAIQHPNQFHIITDYDWTCAGTHSNSQTS